MDWVIGYDAREEYLGGTQRLGASWKMQALLRADVDRPLSVDKNVWPSLFEVLEVEVPQYTGPVPGFWASLTTLEAAIADAPRAADLFCIACFAVVGSNLSEALSNVWERRAQYIEPNAVLPSWSLLGFDVADGSGTSALSNMRVRRDTLKLKSRFGPYLNRAHLFRNPEAAKPFVVYANQAIAEHAPFFTYAIWRTATVCRTGDSA